MDASQGELRAGIETLFTQQVEDLTATEEFQRAGGRMGGARATTTPSSRTSRGRT